jgi:NAD-dependent DNA ligase
MVAGEITDSKLAEAQELGITILGEARLQVLVQVAFAPHSHDC